MSETLYRKYRPKKFEDVIGQNYIVKTLKNAIESNNLSHAYLFSGPRGTGKTTMARLFAYAINCSPRDNFQVCSENVCSELLEGNCVDLIEIDAASYTGVDNIRQLRETIGLSPALAKYKIYIIDEVHMLSIGAFNALLKTLEEPPAHAIFILATTEIQKVPDTIVSRCQRFDFSRLSVDDIIKKLKFILSSEEIEFTDEALEAIAIMAGGGMRDAESLLSQVLAFVLNVKNKISLQDVNEILGISSSLQVLDFVKSVIHNDIHGAISIINNIVWKGVDLDTFCSSVLIYFRALMFYAVSPNEEFDSDLIFLPNSQKKELIEMRDNINLERIVSIMDEISNAKNKIKFNSSIPQLPLEIAVVNICTHKENKQVVKKNIKKEVANKNESEISVDKLRSEWINIQKQVKLENKQVYSLLSQVNPYKVHKNSVILAVRYSIHKDQLEKSDNILTIKKVLDKMFVADLNIEIECVEGDLFCSLSPSASLQKASEVLGGEFVK